MKSDVHQAISALKQGGVILYPTESVIGIGCDPFNKEAVMALLNIKQRDSAKGLILLGSDWQQLENYIQPIETARFNNIKASKNITWIFPKTAMVPDWISGHFNTVAVRVTSHPIAKQLCQEFGKPLVSTSANLSGEQPSKTFSQLSTTLCRKVDAIIKQACGPLNTPTQIRDAITDEILR